MGHQFGEDLREPCKDVWFYFHHMGTLAGFWAEKFYKITLASVLRIIGGEDTGPGRNGTEMPVGNSQLGNF